jgi:hypothetical protein
MDAYKCDVQICGPMRGFALRFYRCGMGLAGAGPRSTHKTGAICRALHLHCD